MHPPNRFSWVEVGLARGGYVKERHYEFLKSLSISTIISLTPDPLHLPFTTTIHLPTQRPKDTLPLSFSKVLSILSLLTDTTMHPMYIHCLDGSLVTSIVIMALRKLQGWSAVAYKQEASRFLREGTLSHEESHFLDKLTGEFEIPLKIPKWLWGGSPINKHPHYKLKSSLQIPQKHILSTSHVESPKVEEQTLQKSALSLATLKLQQEKEDLRRLASNPKSMIDVDRDPELEEEEQEETSSTRISRTLDALDLDVTHSF